MTPPTSGQKLAVLLAFLVAALSLAGVAVAFARRGEVPITPLVGGLFMLALGVSGYLRLKSRR